MTGEIAVSDAAAWLQILAMALVAIYGPWYLAGRADRRGGNGGGWIYDGDEPDSDDREDTR